MTDDIRAAHFDSIVIGGGPAGLGFSQKAAGLGAKVALVEAADIGGTCVNRGCVPKKLVWYGARSCAEMSAAAECGLAAKPEMDFGALHVAVREKVQDIRASYVGKLDDSGVKVINGKAEIQGAGRILVDGESYTADQIVIATGARPQIPEIDGIELAETSDQVFHWTALPHRLAILGGGYIGCEFASIFNALGTDVTLIETDDTLLNGFDPDLAARAEDLLRDSGVTVCLGANTKCLAESPDGQHVVLEGGAPVSVDRIIVATGRTPNLDGLGALVDGMERGRNDSLAISDRFETSVEGIFAIGDAADRLPLTPVARRDGETLAQMLHGNGGALLDLAWIPTACQTIPPVAQVGDLAPDNGHVAQDTVAPLFAGVLVGSDRGLSATLAKLAYDANGRLTGAGFVSEGAADLIASFSALGEAGASREDIARSAGVHPTFAEDLFG